MHRPRLLDLTLAALAALALPACGAKDQPAAKPAPHAEEEKPPHGGELLELGADHSAHLEVMHDHAGGNIGVYAYGAALTKPVAIARPEISVQTKDGPVSVVLTAVDAKPDGTAHFWKGQHAALIADPWDGRIRVVIDGKTYQSALEGEGHDHDHK